MQMEAGLDTGPMLLREAVPIGPRDDGGRRCTTRWPALGARLILRALAETPDAGAAARGGRDLRAEADPRRRPARLDPADAAELDRQVRGLLPGPAPGRRCGGETLKVLRGRGRSPAAARPGTVLDDGLLVACGDGRAAAAARAAAGPRRRWTPRRSCAAAGAGRHASLGGDALGAAAGI